MYRFEGHPARRSLFWSSFHLQRLTDGSQNKYCQTTPGTLMLHDAYAMQSVLARDESLRRRFVDPVVSPLNRAGVTWRPS